MLALGGLTQPASLVPFHLLPIIWSGVYPAPEMGNQLVWVGENGLQATCLEVSMEVISTLVHFQLIDGTRIAA